MDHGTLSILRERNPAWRLLASSHAPLIASFLHRVFVAPNVRTMSEADLSESLQDELFSLRDQFGDAAYPRDAREYLNEWAAADKGWLRKFYKPGTDEPQFDLTPATEKAIAWLVSLSERLFVGTESRLLTLFSLLEQISAGTETDAAKRVEGFAPETRRDRRGDRAGDGRRRANPGRDSREGTASSSSSNWRANCWPTSARSSTTSASSIARCARRSLCGKAARARCSTRSWASAMRSATPTRAAAFALSGIS